MGQTRLVREHAAAAVAAQQGTEGPWHAELGALVDDGHVPQAVAAAVGVATGDVTSAALVGAIGDRRGILLLDGCEAVADGAADLVETLTACSELRIVATGLAPLGVDGERLLTLGPLDLAPDGEAVRLFIAAARRAVPGFRPGPGAMAHIRTVCRELDGMPLAIELAAGQVDRLEPDQIAAALDDRLRLLGGGPATRRHHRTLHAAIAWSTDQLGDAARAALAAAAVFTGGFVRPALVGVLGDVGTSPEDVGRGLGELELRGMVVPGRGGPGRRLRLLDSVRRHAIDGLPARRLADLQDAHARWVARLTARADAGLRTSEGGRWWRRLADEQANIRRALSHGLDGGDPAVSLAVAGHMGWYWYRLGDVAEGRRWLGLALAAAPSAPDPLRARAHLALALLEYLGGRVDEVHEHAGFAIALRADDPVVAARAHGLRALVAAGAGDVTTAADVLGEIDVAALPGWARAEIEMVAAQLLAVRGDPAGALDGLRRARATAEVAGHQWAEGSSAWFAAKLLIDLGRPTEAGVELRGVLPPAIGSGERTGPLAAINTLAVAEAMAGQSTRAATLLAEVERWGPRLGFDPVAMDPVHGPVHRAQLEGLLDVDTRRRGREQATSTTFAELLEYATGSGRTSRS